VALALRKDSGGDEGGEKLDVSFWKFLKVGAVAMPVALFAALGGAILMNMPFRADLFYRLNAFTVRLPLLRERQSDILPLAEYFLVRYAQRNQLPSTGLSADAIVALQNYTFPGNVRELEHLIERAAVKAGGAGYNRPPHPRRVSEREDCRAGHLRRSGSRSNAVPRGSRKLGTPSHRAGAGGVPR